MFIMPWKQNEINKHIVSTDDGNKDKLYLKLVEQSCDI